jgi:hypothetical protein
MRMRFAPLGLLRKALVLAAAMVLGPNLAHATLSYTCDPSIAASTCTYLNTTVAGYYNSTFTNVNADIYVTYGNTGLGSGEAIYNYNQMSYSTYLSDYAANATASGNAAQASGVASLNTYATPVYGSAEVSVSGALGQALGIPASQLKGFSSNGTAGCTLSAAGCYDDVLTITNDLSTPLYYRTGGSIASNAYDFYSVVEHETDEALGTQSCIETQTPPYLENNCAGNVAAADLFRYQSPGSLINILVTPSSIPTTPGAYLSVNGGVTNALGAGRYYNTLVNGEDYGDFSNNTVCNSGSTPDAVQDGEGCPGEANLNITNDGGPEIAMLNAVGFDLRSSSVPEPVSLALLLPGLAGVFWLRHRGRSAAAA